MVNNMFRKNKLKKNNKSIEVQGNFDLEKKKINGVQVMHKWYF